QHSATDREDRQVAADRVEQHPRREHPYWLEPDRDRAGCAANPAQEAVRRGSGPVREVRDDREPTAEAAGEGNPEQQNQRQVHWDADREDRQALDEVATQQERRQRPMREPAAQQRTEEVAGAVG